MAEVRIIYTLMSPKLILGIDKGTSQRSLMNDDSLRPILETRARRETIKGVEFGMQKLRPRMMIHRWLDDVGTCYGRNTAKVHGFWMRSELVFCIFLSAIKLVINGRVDEDTNVSQPNSNIVGRIFARLFLDTLEFFGESIARE